jgi:hypothetical protein
MSVHIECYLSEQAEFETDINPITVDICSSSTTTTTTLILTLTLAFALDATKLTFQLDDEPLPSIEGCGLRQHRLGSLRSEDVAPSAPPLSKGMWAQRRGKGGGERRGKEVGKERKTRW